MFVSRPVVQPVEAPTLADAAENPPRVRMKDVQGMPGTPGGLALRFFQSIFAVAALDVMVSTGDFSSVTAFCYLVVVVGLQSLWSRRRHICASSEAQLAESPTHMLVNHWRWGHLYSQSHLQQLVHLLASQFYSVTTSTSAR